MTKHREPKWNNDEYHVLYVALHQQVLADEACYQESGVHQPLPKICEQINERFNANTRRKARSMSSIINRWHILVMRSNAYTMYHLLEVVVILTKNA